MSVSTSTDANPPREPAWDIARLFPDQGTWSIDDYLELTNSSNQRVEFDDGNIEVLAMPTEAHELIIRFLFLAMYNFATPKQLGEAFFSGIRVRNLNTKYRIPDIVFMLTENRHRRTNDFWDGADLVMEVVSPDAESRTRDLVKKKQEYAAASIPEYWIVDPRNSQVTVLTLQNGDYVEHGTFQTGEHATSVLLQEFSIDVSAVFAAAKDA